MQAHRRHPGRLKPALVPFVSAVLSVLAGAVFEPSVAAASEPTLLSQVGSAYVAQDADGRSWTIGNDGIRFRVGLNATGLLVAQALERPDVETSWRVGQSADLTFTAQSRQVSPGQSGFPFRTANGDEERGAVRLRLAFDYQAASLRVTRTYLCYPGVPAIETFTTFEALAADVAVSDMGVWELALDVNALNWLTGLQASVADGGRFTHRRQVLATRASLQLGATGRSSEQTVPSVWFESGAGQLFGAILWSGAWHLSVAGPEVSGLTAIRFVVDQATTTVRRGSPVETPRGMFGVTGTDPADVALALRAYTIDGLRQGRAMPALVVHNTWFAYGVEIDEETLRAEMKHAAEFGAEVFVVDAGWYPGGTTTSDFTTGLGTWAADTRRFPDGLRPLRDHAHDLGLKFGIWVEPERVDTATVGRTGLAKERYLATIGGRYNAGVRNENADAAQICLADREAREWVIGRLFAFLDEVQPDYLKWDNNYWINCDRTSHGHGSGDGNFAHVKGLYDVLAHIRDRYPDLVIENCATGGNRLDLGMAQYTDVAWMDDVSGPSSHVRHNLTGLGLVFPPAYLLSFVMDDPAEPIHGAEDMSFYFRSRMVGALGLSIRGGEFGDEDQAAMQREIQVYKLMRESAGDAVLWLLTGASDVAATNDWEAMQWYSPGTGNLVALAFAGDAAPPDFILQPQGVDVSAEYELTVPRVSVAERLSGETIVDQGFRLQRSPVSDAYLLFIRKERHDQ